LQALADTVGRLQPTVRRQVLAALAMDRVDMTFHHEPNRAPFADLPLVFLGGSARTTPFGRAKAPA
jgi:hypothetical protein